MVLLCMTSKDKHSPDCMAFPPCWRCMETCARDTGNSRPPRWPHSLAYKTDKKNMISRVTFNCLLLTINTGNFLGFAAFTRLIMEHLTSRSWGGVLYHRAVRILRSADTEDEK